MARWWHDEVFIVPAAEDSGIALGAAYVALWARGGDRPRRGRLRRDSLGATYGDDDIQTTLRRLPAVTGARSDDVVAETCDRLATGQVVGWFQDGAELGPRALGHRSLLCDPRAPEAKERMNAKVKFREAFRPFAPILAEEDVCEWFVAPSRTSSPFMLSALPWRPDRAGRVPAVVHVDGSGRLQTVARDDEPLTHDLLTRWRARSGVSVLINTSFNLAGEPIVETPEDAIRCLLSSGIDCVVVGAWIVELARAASVLDLAPVGLGRPIAADPQRHEVITRWGACDVELDTVEAAVVAAATGDATGRELVDACARGTDPLSATRLLHRLARLGALSFPTPPPAPRAPAPAAATSARPNGQLTYADRA